MKKILSILMFLIGVYSIPVYSSPEPENESEEVTFYNEPNNTSGRPKKPAYCPVNGVRSGCLLTLYSTVSGEAEIVITDIAGIPVYEDSAELYGGYTIVLDETVDYGMVCVTLSGRTYKATL